MAVLKFSKRITLVNAMVKTVISKYFL